MRKLSSAVNIFHNFINMAGITVNKGIDKRNCLGADSYSHVLCVIFYMFTLLLVCFGNFARPSAVPVTQQ
jgi:hypothetical protein